jgi:hypothetical protein
MDSGGERPLLHPHQKCGARERHRTFAGAQATTALHELSHCFEPSQQACDTYGFTAKTFTLAA